MHDATPAGSTTAVLRWIDARASAVYARCIRAAWQILLDELSFHRATFSCSAPADSTPRTTSRATTTPTVDRSGSSVAG